MDSFFSQSYLRSETIDNVNQPKTSATLIGPLVFGALLKLSADTLHQEFATFAVLSPMETKTHTVTAELYLDWTTFGGDVLEA